MRLLHLDSRFRQNTSAPSGTPVFQLQGGPIRTSKLRLVSATIPVSWYTFTTADNTFVITPTGGSATSVTIAAGFIYTLTGLATALQSAINTALGISTFTVTASTSSLKLLLTHPSVGFTVTFASDRIAEVLGFANAGTVATSGSDVFLSSTHVCELTTPSVHITGSLGASSYHPATTIAQLVADPRVHRRVTTVWCVLSEPASVPTYRAYRRFACAIGRIAHLHENIHSHVEILFQSGSER
jgi:hypothetical protein